MFERPPSEETIGGKMAHFGLAFMKITLAFRIFLKKPTLFDLVFVGSFPGVQ